MLYLMKNFLVLFQAKMQIKGYLEITLVNVTYLAAMNINSVILKIKLIQITTVTMMYIYVNCRYYNDNEFKQKYKTSKGFSIIHFNCRSLLCNIHKIKEYLQCLSFNFDVIVLSETWLNLYDNSDVLNLVGYDLCSKTRQNKIGGGVAMYIWNDIRFEVLDNKSCSIGNVLECICVKLYLSLKRSIIVSCLHRRTRSTINTTIDLIIKNFSGKKMWFIYLWWF